MMSTKGANASAPSTITITTGLGRAVAKYRVADEDKSSRHNKGSNFAIAFS
jgi:hypothetical protein